MKNLLFATLFLFTISSCTETKNTVAASNSSTPSISTSDMISQGFSAGVVTKSSSESGCPYTLETREGPYSYDPTNLGNEFKKDGLKVWFKFHPLRRQSRCNEATPVEITEMQLMR